MSENSRQYAIHSNEESERLELQARLANIEGHLRHLPVSPRDRVLDAGCGSGAISRLIARSYAQADVIGVDMREQYLDYPGKVTDHAVPAVPIASDAMDGPEQCPFVIGRYDVPGALFSATRFCHQPLASQNRWSRGQKCVRLKGASDVRRIMIYCLARRHHAVPAVPITSDATDGPELVPFCDRAI